MIKLMLLTILLIFRPTAGEKYNHNYAVFRKAEIQKNAKNVECKICGKIEIRAAD